MKRRTSSDKLSMSLTTTTTGLSGCNYDDDIGIKIKNILFFSLVELKAAMASLGENMSSEDVERMMNQADSNSDGLVSFEEFAAMMNK